MVGYSCVERVFMSSRNYDLDILVRVTAVASGTALKFSLLVHD